jgi:hypothetical protein
LKKIELSIVRVRILKLNLKITFTKIFKIKFKIMKKIKSIFIITFLFSGTACAYWLFGKEAPQCYWMENFSGDSKWVSVKEFLGAKCDKRKCYEADSCDGGLSQSGGGCYKWSKGANGKRQSWDDVKGK